MDKCLIEYGTISDINELENLYDLLNEYLSKTINYPGWIKGIYPVRKTAEDAIKERSLFVLKKDGRIAGSIILNHEPEIAYKEVKWNTEAEDHEVLVIRTLVTHPRFMHEGVATHLMEFAKEYAIRLKMKSIRLDVSIHNTPAIKLYEQSGYTYIGTVDLGLPYAHLKWFRLYERVL
ncbi:MAG: GNAT family N-acetyltransferase [Bacteroidales bacterium]|nr:GNAT family N-acetyltransferase [Bacteroidales bacterium]